MRTHLNFDLPILLSYSGLIEIIIKFAHSKAQKPPPLGNF
jgi:hypothetical protein